MEIIRQITAEKTRGNIVPTHATRMEVLARYSGPVDAMDKELAELTRIFEVVAHPTINNTSFELTEL